MSEGSALQTELLPRTSAREVMLWVASGLIVLGVHAAVFFEAQHWQSSQPPEQEAPTAMMVDLAPIAVAPEAVPSEIVELDESMAVEPEQPPTETLAPDVVDETTPVEEVPLETATLDEIEPIEEPELVPIEPEVIPDLVEAPLPEVAMAIPTERPEIVEPEVEPDPKPKPVVKEPSKKKTEKPVKKAVSKPAPATKASAEDAPNKAAPKVAEGARSNGVSPASWRSRVSSRLNRFKRCPARGTGAGVANVSMRIDDSGRILSATLSRSSGVGELDQAAVNMVKRASPLPPPPPGIARSITVPVNFTCR